MLSRHVFITGCLIVVVILHYIECLIFSKISNKIRLVNNKHANMGIIVSVTFSRVHGDGNPINLHQPVRLRLFHGGAHSRPLSIWCVSYIQSVTYSKFVF